MLFHTSINEQVLVLKSENFYLWSKPIVISFLTLDKMTILKSATFVFLIATLAAFTAHTQNTTFKPGEFKTWATTPPWVGTVGIVMALP